MTGPITLVDIAVNTLFPAGLVLALAGLIVFSLAWPRDSLAWRQTFGRPGFVAVPLGALCTYVVASTFVCLEQRGMITNETMWMLLGVLLVGIFLNVRHSARRAETRAMEIADREPVPAARPRRADVDAAAA